MKNLLLLLILANILYFVWGFLTEEPPETGIAVVDESQLGSPLEVSNSSVAASATSVGAVLGSGKPSDLAAVVVRFGAQYRQCLQRPAPRHRTGVHLCLLNTAPRR